MPAASSFSRPDGPSGPVVGFDLDLTLLDTRPGIRAVYEHLAAEHGLEVDAELASSRLGPPLEVELAQWAPPERIPHLITAYRTAYPDLAVAPSVLLPGAREAVDAVHRLGGRVLVITGKYEPNALLHLEHLGLPYDRLAGTRWGTGKTDVLVEEGAQVYVGDHVGDMRSARAAGALAVGVPVAEHDTATLREAGADVLLPSLTAFPAWLDGAGEELARRPVTSGGPTPKTG